MRKLLIAGLAVGALAACGGGEGGGEKAPASKPAAAPSSAAAAPSSAAAAPSSAAPGAKDWLKIDKYGVQIEVPAGAKAEDAAGTSLMIMSPDGSCTVMLAKKDDMSYFPSYDSTVGDIEKGLMGKKKEMLKNEKVDDSNWTIYYTKDSAIEPGKVQYAVDVRKKLANGDYSCARVNDTEADAKCVLDACLSLKVLDGAAAPGSAAGSAPASAAGSAPASAAGSAAAPASAK